jgi:DNA-binding response OmpR family regulator
MTNIAERPKVLVIDDDQDLLETFQSLLSSDYDVVTANNGADAIKKSSEAVFNIALIDIVLPDIDGTQLLKRIKSGFPKIRKIIVTGHASVENAVKALNQGADAFLIKPVAPEALLRTINDQLKGQQRDIELAQQKLNGYFNNKLYESKENILTDIFNNMDLGIEVWERKGYNNFMLIYSNPASERITGTSGKETWKSIDEVFHPLQQSQSLNELLDQSITWRRSDKAKVECHLNDGQKKDLLMRIVPLRGAFVATIVEVIED